MTWVDMETEAVPWEMIAYGVALLLGAAIWWWLGICAGLIAYINVGIALTLVRDMWLQARLPQDAHHATQRVLAWFQERFPDERAEGVAVRAVEPGRFVIAVLYGIGRPTPRRYFAISRLDPGEISELPVDEWWPRGLK